MSWRCSLTCSISWISVFVMLLNSSTGENWRQRCKENKKEGRGNRKEKNYQATESMRRSDGFWAWSGKKKSSISQAWVFGICVLRASTVKCWPIGTIDQPLAIAEPGEPGPKEPDPPEGRKASRASKTTPPPPPLSARSGSVTPQLTLDWHLGWHLIYTWSTSPSTARQKLAYLYRNAIKCQSIHVSQLTLWLSTNCR